MLPTLLYTCETWTVYQRHAKKLNHFHTTCLRKLLNIKWQDRIPDTEVLAQADLPNIYTILMQSQLLGRTCSPHARQSAPKKALLWRTTARKVVPWRPEEALQRHSKNIPESVCHHPRRAKWRSSVHKGSKICEANRTAAAEQRRQARKARDSNPQEDVPLIPCPNCQRTFRARIGLVSHLRTHQIQPQLPPDD